MTQYESYTRSDSSRLNISRGRRRKSSEETGALQGINFYHILARIFIPTNTKVILTAVTQYGSETSKSLISFTEYALRLSRAHLRILTGLLTI